MSNLETKKVKKVITIEDKKRHKKIAIICVSAVLVAILIVGLILGLVPVKSMSDLTDYDFARIYTSKSATESQGGAISSQYDSQLDSMLKEGLKKTKFSILRAVFEGNFANANKLIYDKVEDPNDKDKTIDKLKEIKPSKLIEETTAGENQYVLELVYGDKRVIQAKTNKGKYQDIHYNQIRIVVSYNQNIIETLKLYAYDNELLGGNTIEAEYYTITPIYIKATTNKLFNNMKSILNFFETNHF